jgi:hypothetical protein
LDAISSRLRHTLLAALLSTAVSALGAAPASAGTHSYCVGCTINSGQYAEDSSAFNLLLDYVHRLSGPSCSQIGAFAHYTDGTFGSEVLASCSSDVQHGYNGSKAGYGAADNLGGGNYGFNAHVDY